MMTYYPWQKNAWQRINAMINSERLPHALLLTGNKGLGLAHFSDLISRRLLCLDRENTEISCGKCQSCQLIDAGSHPDYVKIEPEEEGKQIRISQIRELIEFAALKSFSNRIKIAVLMPAEAMNRATANALLKTLEEPPEQSMLILISHYPDRLPITIRSRCQRIDFKPNYDLETVSWLEQQGINSELSTEQLLKLADGGPLTVMDMLNEEGLPNRLALVEDIRAVISGKTDPVKLAASWENMGCANVISWLMRICQDLAKLKLLKDGNILVNQDIHKELVVLARQTDLAGIMRIYDFLQLKYRQATAQTSYNSLSILEEIIIYWNNPTQIP